MLWVTEAILCLWVPFGRGISDFPSSCFGGCSSSWSLPSTSLPIPFPCELRSVDWDSWFALAYMLQNGPSTRQGTSLAWVYGGGLA